MAEGARRRFVNNDPAFLSVTQEDLQSAADAKLISESEVDPLFTFLRNRSAASTRGVATFSVLHIFYYLGGALAIAATAMFTALAREWSFEMWFGITLTYMVCSLIVAHLLEQSSFDIAAGVMASLAVACVPPATWLLQSILGFWDGTSKINPLFMDYVLVDNRILTIEAATMIGASLVLLRFRYPFLVLPIASTFWLIAMELIPRHFGVILGAPNFRSDTLYGYSSILTSMLLLALAFVLDKKRGNKAGKDYAFWLYFCGVNAFELGLAALHTGHIEGKFQYLGVHIAMLFIGAVLARRVFAVFGGIGIATILGDLAFFSFKFSIPFVVSLTLIGFGFIVFGAAWDSYETKIAQGFKGLMGQHIV